jgi:hypothetical protein
MGSSPCGGEGGRRWVLDWTVTSRRSFISNSRLATLEEGSRPAGCEEDGNPLSRGCPGGFEHRSQQAGNGEARRVGSRCFDSRDSGRGGIR